MPEALLALNGGEGIRTGEWPTYDKGYVDLSDGDEAAALRAIQSRRLFRYDNRAHGETEVGQLEQELASYFDSPYALACASGTTACWPLHSLVLAFDRATRSPARRSLLRRLRARLFLPGPRH